MFRKLKQHNRDSIIVIMAETAIFRPREESEDREFMEKVEPVEEMDSTDSSLTGINSASDQTTITVHRVMEKPMPTNDSRPNQTQSFPSTNPVTPDASVLAPNPVTSSDEDIGAQRESGAIEREITPPKEETTINKNSVSSGGRSSYSNSRRMMRRNGRSLRDDDSSSSDDDSSYFAKNLPSPKSGRSFSMSSNASNASALFQIQKQGSDASLSFSDESDDDHHHQSNLTSGVHLSPVVNPNRSVVDMNLYPQRITRMHSVSSLVSSASSDNLRDHDAGMLSEDDNAPNRRRSFTGDSSVNSSLPSIASTGPDAMQRNIDATSGYFVQGNSYQQPPAAYGVTYYAPQGPTLTNQQMQAWASPPPKDAGGFDPKMNFQSRSSLQSQSSGSLNYKFPDEDDKPNDAQFYASASMGKQQANGAPAAGNGAGAGGLGGLPSGTYGGSGYTGAPKSFNGAPQSSAPSAATAEDKLTAAPGGGEVGSSGRQTFKVYWQRWIMLFYMSVLNLLSDWTCYSVAPISLLTEQAFGDIDPERLVVVFLGANAVASACEPMILARLGLRRTVLLGSFLLTIGSLIKSGGLPPFFEPTLEVGHAESSLYLGFFIVGLSQPLYQCTPALLSASWFPEEERTMATGVALNANQLGIGFAFIFGTLLVAQKEDIIPYFGLLSQISTLCLIGTLIQFDDAPPTPPSASARVMKGNLNFSLPDSDQIRSYFTSSPEKKASAQAPTPASNEARKKRSSKSRKASSSSSRDRATRRRNNSQIPTANSENGLSAAPSSAHYGSTADAMRHIAQTKAEVESLAITPIAHAPSPAGEGEGEAPNPDESNPDTPPPPGAYPPGQMPGYYGYGYPPPPPPQDYQYYQQMQMQAFYQQQMLYQQQMQQQQQLSEQPPQAGMPPPPPLMPMPYFPPPQQMAMPYSYQNQYQAPYGGIDYRPDAYDFDDEGAEPTVTVTNHHLDIDIRDDQVIRSLHACMIRQGFSHALAAFTVSGIVINTLSTYMDYLVRLNGAPRSYTGIVGGAFQFGIMLSSLIMGKKTDNTRAYYSVTTGMLVVGAFGLAECGVSLDSNRGSNLRWSLLLVAVLVGPLQPISTELGVEVAYPLSENTVLVIQQLFSNLLSALFIPFFKSLKDIGTRVVRGGKVIERPEYTFSFYLLIVLHTLVTVYFATFNGRYLRYEHELQKKDEEERKEDAEKQALLAGEQAPLMANATR